MRERIRRRGRQLVLMLYAVAMLGSAAMVIGPFMNDTTINSDPGRALATVTGTDWLRTAVEYRDETGIYHSPLTGLLYPTGLGQGQRVWVAYAKTDPDLVKVEGREWTLSVIPALSVALLSTVIAALLWWAVGKITGQTGRSPRIRPE